MRINLDEKKTERYISFFLLICIVVGAILHIVPYVFNRSLWIDEAMLASSIYSRNITNLVSSPLDFGQSSAIGYLYIVKIITLLLGTSEATLRVFSLISSFGCIILVYCLLSNKVQRNYALFFTAIFALTDRFIYYGNELKPYMFDNMLCLLTLLIWQKYKDKKIALWKVVIIYSITIWFSFSAVFFVAACMIIECFTLFRKIILERNKHVVWELCLCAIVLFSFVLNFILWLSKTSDNAGGAEYWELLRFPLIPTSLSDLKLIIKMAVHFFRFFSRYAIAIFIILFMMYIVACIMKKEDSSHIVVPFWISLFILFVASYCGFYPIQDRLVQIYQLIVVILAGFGCNMVTTKIKNGNQNEVNWIVIFYYGVLAFCLAVIGMSGCKNIFASHVFKAESEVSESIAYLDKNLVSNDVVYVFRNSIPVYQYETGDIRYNSWTEMPDKPTVFDDNVIYGQSLISYFYQVPYSYEYEENNENVNEDTEAIIKNDSVYIFASHGEAGLPWLLEQLEKYGTVNVVVDYYGTHLYHFVKEKE